MPFSDSLYRWLRVIYGQSNTRFIFCILHTDCLNLFADIFFFFGTLFVWLSGSWKYLNGCVENVKFVVIVLTVSENKMLIWDVMLMWKKSLMLVIVVMQCVENMVIQWWYKICFYCSNVGKRININFRVLSSLPDTVLRRIKTDWR